MRVRTDDDLYRVDRTYLGPRNRAIPLQVTYRQWFIFLGLLVLSLTAWRSLALPLDLPVFLVLLVGIWFAAQWISQHLTYDRPLLWEIVRVIQELVAPRPELHEKPQVHQLHLEVPRWRAGAQPDPRWWVRAGHTIGNIWGRMKRGFRKSGQVYENGEWRDVR